LQARSPAINQLPKIAHLPGDLYPTTCSDRRRFRAEMQRPSSDLSRSRPSLWMNFFFKCELRHTLDRSIELFLSMVRG
jgi:hypothetical protein